MSLTTPTVTGYSGMFQLTGDLAPYAFMSTQARASIAKFLAREMKRGGTRDAIGALAALIGAAPGGNASNTWTRRQGPAATSQTVPGTIGVADLGGLITMETATAINRATTAADVTELKKWFNNAILEAGITYPTITGNNAANSTQLNGVTRF